MLPISCYPAESIKDLEYAGVGATFPTRLAFSMSSVGIRRFGD